MSGRRRGGPPRRRVRSPPAKRSFRVFTEGERTEPIYLKHRYAAVRDTVTMTFGEPGAPRRIVDAAIAERRTGSRDGRPYDEIWCVFDRDDHPDIDAIRRRAEDAGVKVAFSCPCFELWLILHLDEQQAHLESRDAERRSRRLLGTGKRLDGASLERLDGSYATAVTRARALDTKHAGDGSPPGSNPSTGVWRLTERLRAPGSGDDVAGQ